MERISSRAVTTEMEDDLQHRHLQNSLDRMTEMTVIPAGEKLFTEGEEPDVLYFLYSGEVRLFVHSGNGVPMTLRVAEPGEVIELGSLFSNRPYQATAEAARDCRVGIITKAKLLHYLRDHAEARLPLLRMLSKDVKDHYELMRHFRW